MTAEQAPGRTARIALACAALMCAVPGLLPFHLSPVPSFHEEWLAAVLGLAAVGAAVVTARNRPLLLPSTVLPLVGFLAVLAVQLVVLELAYRQQVLLAMLYALWALAIAWCGLQLRESAGLERACRVIALALLVAGLLQAVAALSQAYLPRGSLAPFVTLPNSPRLFGNLNQANLLADLLALAFASLLYLGGRMRLAVAVPLGLVLAAAMALTGSRGVWLYAGWLLGWAAVAWLRTHATAYRSAAVGVVALVGTLALLALVLPGPALQGQPAVTGPGTGLERLAAMNIEAGRAGSEATRLYFWSQAWAMFERAPLLGVGFGQFAWHFLLQSVQFADFGIPGQERNAHNLVLHLLAETGLAGTLFVVGALGLWFWRALRAPVDPERWWLVGVAGVIGLHSLLEYPLWHAHFLGPFALILGLGETRPFAPRRAAFVRAALVGVTVVGLALLVSLQHGFIELRRWIYLVPEAMLRDATVVARQREVLQRLQPTLLGPYAELPFAAVVDVDRKDLAAKLEFNGRVMRFSPIAPVVYRQIVFLALAGRDAEAGELLDRAAVLHPAELGGFAKDLERLAARGLALPELAGRVAARRGKT